MREDEIIIRVTRDFLENSRYSQADFAVDMLAKELELVEPKESAERYTKYKGRVKKNVSRIMTGSQPFPAKWIDSWVAALPEQYAKQCRELIASKNGYMDSMPDLAGADSTKAETALMMNLFADVVATNSAAHDGVYDENDDVAEANENIDAKMRLVMELIKDVRRIHAGTGATGKIFDVSGLIKL